MLNLARMAIVFCSAVLLAGCNLHEVDPGALFRSAQLSGVEFEQLIKEKGIKTVINLRGVSTENWWKEEAAVMEKYGVVHVNIGMSAGRIPHRDDLIALLDTFKTAPRPILIHCMAGVDRTGEAAALYQMIYMGKSKTEALEMLTPKYGHFEIFKPAKIYFIKEVWQSERWAYEAYDPCYGDYKYYDKNNSKCTGGIPAPDEDAGGDT